MAALTDSANTTDYIKKMRKRDPLLSEGWGQLVTPLLLTTPGGRQRINCADAEGMFRIIQSIPSPKAEPFKLWMAHVAAERIDQIQDPELSIQKARNRTEDRAQGHFAVECVGCISPGHKQSRSLATTGRKWAGFVM